MKRSLSLIAWVAVVSLVAGAVSNEPATVGSKRSAPILAAHDGHVTRLAMQFHRDGSERFLPVFEQIVGALAEDTEVLVSVADAEDEALLRRHFTRWTSRRAGPSLRTVIVGETITSWARDRLAVLDGPVLVAPPRPMTGGPARAHDWRVPWALRGALDHGRIVSAPFAFEGGDLIADDRNVYVATPLFERNEGLPAAELLRRVASTTGRRPVHVGAGGEVPDHHIGMFLTPLGGGRVAYGEPALALTALGAETQRLSTSGGELDLDLRPERLRRFRNVRRELERNGLTPVPIPILPAREPWVFLSYDNVLLDERADGLHVLMPVYGVAPLDAAARNAWEAVGAIVHPIDVGPVFRLGGSVRCLVAPLERRLP